MGLSRLRRKATDRVSMSNRQPFPFVCCEASIDGKLLPFFWDWIGSGSPGIQSVQDSRGYPRRTAAECAKKASETDNPGVLSELARREWPYVRAAVTANPDVPEFAIWGDGITCLGLAGDSDPWVKGITLLHSPTPPPALVKALEDQVKHRNEIDGFLQPN